jgi:hypothetical protein
MARTIIIPGDRHLTPSEAPTTVRQQAGLFYNDALPAEQVTASQQALLAGTGTFEDVQVWGQNAWKTPHGSYASVRRFGDKSLEEHRELREALDAYLFRRPEDDAEYLHKEAVSELGDTVFSMTLLALNASVDLPAAVRALLQSYSRDTQHFVDGQAVTPPWLPAAQVAAAEKQPRTDAIDQLMAAGFQPELSSHMHIYDEETEAPRPTAEELSERAMWLIAHIATARNDTDRQYAYGGELDVNGILHIDEQLYAELAQRIGHTIGQIYLEAAFIARHGLDSSLTNVLQHTVAKISGRLATNTIDKADGPRAT